MPRDRALVLILSRRSGPPWWWDQIAREHLGCEVDYEVVALNGPRPAGPWSPGFFPMLWQCLRVLAAERRRGTRWIVTFECDWTSFIVAGVQSLLFLRSPRHLIVQFIMRENTGTLKSRLKYAFMRWCFSSVHLCVCSSRGEAAYYVRAFGWPERKVAFLPLHTDPSFLQIASGNGRRETGGGKTASAGTAVDHGTGTAVGTNGIVGSAIASVPPATPALVGDDDGTVVAAGRTFRDYPTLLRAWTTLDLPLTIVASPSSLGGEPVPPAVSVLYDIPMTELIDRLARCMIVVLPLEDRQISTGQTVLVHAMTMGKPVIVTKTNGTVDYVEDMQTAVLVPPRDPDAIARAVRLLAADPALRRRIGEAARARVLTTHMPSQYARGIADMVRTQ
ncbi:MAG: glycosyltransferase family 4 protein [Acidobacteria bacterium]|nr:glycosyltransferase family 4 protein [Acidobacteriota bacterium]